MYFCFDDDVDDDVVVENVGSSSFLINMDAIVTCMANVHLFFMDKKL